MTRRRAVVVGSLALVAVAALGTYLLVRPGAPSGFLHVVNPEHNAAGVVMQNVPLHTPYVYVTYNVCTDGGPVTVATVATRDSVGEIKVVDWAVREGSYGVNDGVPGRSRSLPGFTSRTVSAKCTADGSSFEALAISVEIDSPAAATDGFTINGSEVDPFAVTECTAAKCPQLLPDSPAG